MFELSNASSRVDVKADTHRTLVEKESPQPGEHLTLPHQPPLLFCAPVPSSQTSAKKPNNKSPFTASLSSLHHSQHHHQSFPSPLPHYPSACHYASSFYPYSPTIVLHSQLSHPT